MAGGVRDCLIGVGVGLKEDPVGSGGKGGAGEGGDVFALSAAYASGGSGKLDAVSGVDDGGVSVGGHDGETAHVDDKVLITKSSASVGLPNFSSPGFFEFADDELHFLGREELPFFDVDSAVGLCRGGEKVGLSAEEGGDLKSIHYRADGLALLGRMNIGDGFKTVFFFYGLKDFESGVESGAAVAANGGAVGFVEGTFKENVELGVLLLEGYEGIGDGAAGLEAFKRAGACEEEQLIGVVEHGGI